MPLNPQIILSGVAPTIKSAGEARMEAIRQQQALMQQQTEQMTLAAKQREVADAEAIRQALKETNGDLEAALPKIRAVSPTAAMAFEKDLQAQKKSKADTSKAEIETQLEHVKLLSQVLQGATPANYPLIRKMVSSAVGTEDGLPTEYDEDAINSLIATGRTASETLQAKRDALNAQVTAAELPGKVADSTIKSNVAAGMQGGLTADQQADNAVQQRQLAISGGNLDVARGHLAVAKGQLALAGQKEKREANAPAGGAKLSATAIDKLAGIDQSLGILNDLESLKSDSWLGPVQGRMTELEIGMPGASVSDKLAKFAAQTATLKNAVVKAITGAQMSEPEAKRIMKQIPDFSDKPNVWKQKLDATRENMQVLKRRTIELSGGTMPTEKSDPLGIR